MATQVLRPRESDILLVVDVQNDFCPGGRLAVDRGDEVVPVINRLASGFPHIAMTQDWHPPNHLSFASSHPGKDPFSQVTMPYGPQTLWPDHCIQGSDGAAFHGGLETTHAEIIIRKGFRRDIDSYSAFFENDHETPTGLSGYLRERGFTRVFVVGLATDFCVRYSAEDARREGFETTVIEGGCRAIDLDGSLSTARSALATVGVGLVDDIDLSG